ncbi:protein daughterless-like [Aedes aegypti]|uniref:Uncharacterized protein n=1 Tax=Aedes aegypti TaxID=7159 RepID=A0A903VDY0_AEDAE|nr:protein daughterless-like [Aedes aegypti]
MYPTDQSISSYGSNPTTPVNSPPPLTSQQQAAAAAAAAAALAQQQSSAAASIHGSGATAGSSSGGAGSSATTSSAAAAAAAAAAVAAAASGGPWQQINPVINNGAGPAGAAGSAAAAVVAAAALNGLPNGSYAPELVHRGLQHMANSPEIPTAGRCDCVAAPGTLGERNGKAPAMEERLDDAINILRNHCEPQVGVSLSSIDAGSPYGPAGPRSFHLALPAVVPPHHSCTAKTRPVIYQ